MRQKASFLTFLKGKKEQTALFCSILQKYILFLSLEYDITEHSSGKISFVSELKTSMSLATVSPCT